MSKYLKLVSFNLRYLWEGDGINSFIARGPLIVNKILSEKPQVICFQEGTDQNIDYLRNKLPEYEFVFNQRNKDMSGEGVAVAYLRSDIILLSATFFWLSDTPSIAGTKYDGQGYWPRVCQSIMLRRKNDGKVIRLYNTHLDNVSEQCRVRSVNNILKHVVYEQEFAVKTPVFIMGDFNALPNSETIYYCNNFKEFPLVDTTVDIPFTYHGFGKIETECKIDYIFMDSLTAEKSYKVRCWSDEKDGVYLSDHYPIELKIIL